MSEIVLAALIAAGASIVTAVLQLVTRREQKNITNKVDETHKQVTVNSHKSEQPTLLDKLDDLARRMDRHDELHEKERNSW